MSTSTSEKAVSKSRAITLSSLLASAGGMVVFAGYLTLAEAVSLLSQVETPQEFQDLSMVQSFAYFIIGLGFLVGFVGLGQRK